MLADAQTAQLCIEAHASGALTEPQAKLLPGPWCCVQDWAKLACGLQSTPDEACPGTLHFHFATGLLTAAFCLSAAQQAGLWTGAGGCVEGSQWIRRAQVRAPLHHQILPTGSLPCMLTSYSQPPLAWQ